ncbi:MAG: ankyrin repeat domain-containing protein, partial [Candidatus Latescibacterota bacterium]|nr:ankyrin repeat domain-containing protein [Candidatus Latescibacterota bacterium]
MADANMERRRVMTEEGKVLNRVVYDAQVFDARTVLDELRALLRRLIPANISVQLDLGDTPLHVAAGMGALATMRMLLMCGALPAIDARNNFGHTPLHVAFEARRVGAAELLVEYGADPTLHFDGFSCRDIAMEHGGGGWVDATPRSLLSARGVRRTVDTCPLGR